ncbi:MAG: MMPL family transporter, partial [Methanomassiliicoccales archaeon]
MFDKLANVIVKHYKKILVAWVIVLIVSVPAMLMVNDVVVYEENSLATGKYESLQASAIISQQFQLSVANSTIIIVLQSDNMTDAHARDFVLELQNQISTSSKIQYLQDIKTVYNVEVLVLMQGMAKLAPQMYMAEQQANASAFLLYGIPAQHLQAWLATDPTLPVEQRDALAYTNTSSFIMSLPSDPANKSLAFGYFHAFSSVWNVSLVADPVQRTTDGIGMAAPAFIAGLPISEAEKLFMGAVLASFNLNDFMDQVKIHQFTINMMAVSSGITNTTFLQDVYNMGPTPDPWAMWTYSNSVVENGTINTYPIQLPPQYLSNFVGADNKTMLVLVMFTKDDGYAEKNGVKPIVENVNTIRSMISSIKSTQPIYVNITTFVTGTAAMSQDVETSSFNDLALIEPFTIIIIIVLMGVLFRSFIAQFVPLAAVGVALGVSQALVFVIGSTVANIHYTALTMMFTILMGVGTDYSIFIITRYREERMKGADRKTGVHTAIVWAGESITTSGATVIISFFSMGLASFSMIQTMGLVFGVSIIVALLVALTLIPSLLMLLGNRIFWPTTGKRWTKYAEGAMAKKTAQQHGYFYKAATFSVKHAKVILIAAFLVTIPTAYMYATTETSFDMIGMMPQTESVKGMEAMTNDFGAGAIMPTQVVFTGDGTVYYGGTSFNTTYLWAVENASKQIASNGIVQQVVGPTRPFGSLIDFQNISYMPTEERQIVLDGMLSTIGKDNSTILLTVTLKAQPESAQAVKFMPELRGQLATFKAATPTLATTTILVGGATAINFDISNSMGAEF